MNRLKSCLRNQRMSGIPVTIGFRTFLFLNPVKKRDSKNTKTFHKY